MEIEARGNRLSFTHFNASVPSTRNEDALVLRMKSQGEDSLAVSALHDVDAAQDFSDGERTKTSLSFFLTCLRLLLRFLTESHS